MAFLHGGGKSVHNVPEDGPVALMRVKSCSASGVDVRNSELPELPLNCDHPAG